VQRSEDTTDRRAKQLFLTPEGLQVVNRIHETVKLLDSELLSSFSDSDISQMAEFIMRLECTVKDVRLRGKR